MPTTPQGQVNTVLRRLDFFLSDRCRVVRTHVDHIMVERVVGPHKYGEFQFEPNGTVWVKIGKRCIPGNPHELTSHVDAVEATDVVLNWLDADPATDPDPAPGDGPQD